MKVVLTKDCLEYMPRLKQGCIDSIVTDPPYGIKFMGKNWDHGVPGVEFWIEALRVLKPGGHLLAFGGPRTYHRLACAIEDAGFEIRDSVMWLFGSGMPKSHNVSIGIDKQAGAIGHRGKRFSTAGGSLPSSQNRELQRDHPDYVERKHVTTEAKQWDGWGTALKPAYEPIILARKPFKGTVAANVLEHGTGALNIDGCRVSTGDSLKDGAHSDGSARGDLPGAIRSDASAGMFAPNRPAVEYVQPQGRWPANIILDPEAGAALDAQSGPCKTGMGGVTKKNDNSPVHTGPASSTERATVGDADNKSGASRFFYCSKASKKEREAGLKPVEGGRANSHPTVKPVALMRYLCRLVTPINGVVLDPFCGSGSTGVAALREGFHFLGIEREEGFAAIARARLKHEKRARK